MILLLESILIWKKISWRINFVFIQFSLNALLFEKSWYEYKNSPFVHKAMCIQLDHDLTKMRCCLSTFMAFYSRRLWISRKNTGYKRRQVFDIVCIEIAYTTTGNSNECPVHIALVILYSQKVLACSSQEELSDGAPNYHGYHLWKKLSVFIEQPKYFT